MTNCLHNLVTFYISFTFIGRPSGTFWCHVKLLITNSTNYIFFTDSWAVLGSGNHLIVVKLMK